MNTSSSLLYLDAVSVTFDGFRALNKLSLVLAHGEMRAIIGPNGAGKTTMMDVITGKTRPDTGDVLFRGVDLTRMDEPAIARLGIGRKFQKPTVFEQLTVHTNLLLSLKGKRQAFAALFARPTQEEAARIDAILTRTRLTPHADRLAGALSHGQKQWLEIGMLLGQDPELLLVDEPVAGMTDSETMQTADLLRDINQTHSVVVVEHDMEFVRALGVRVTVLHEGSVLAEGSVEQVSANQRVVEVYLGLLSSPSPLWGGPGWGSRVPPSETKKESTSFLKKRSKRLLFSAAPPAVGCVAPWRRIVSQSCSPCSA
jgi:urea transport system ATP-binding protein